MNRLVLIGNGFDLAHGLKTSYKDFIQWYWNQTAEKSINKQNPIYEDDLFSLRPNKVKISTNNKEWLWLRVSEWYNNLKDIVSDDKKIKDLLIHLKTPPQYFKIDLSEFFSNINNEISSKNWVDIENEYYKLLVKYAKEDITESAKREKIEGLNKELDLLKKELIKYLRIQENQVTGKILDIHNMIYDSLKMEDIATSKLEAFFEHVITKINEDYKSATEAKKRGIEYEIFLTKDEHKKRRLIQTRNINWEYSKPEQIMVLSFNYTSTIHKYTSDSNKPIKIIPIHGYVGNTSNIIFGYGDELDENYKLLENLNDNSALINIKSHHYLESPNYKKLLDFAEADAFQICIFGHSCGNSDRTLLNTLFEHKNCVSIKPYYYGWQDDDGIWKDNYMDLVINISRNFNDKKLLRERVVNKKNISI